MDVMTHEQMWKRYKTLMKDKPSDYKIRCHLCNEVIGEGDPDIEYSKTKSDILTKKATNVTILYVNCGKRYLFVIRRV